VRSFKLIKTISHCTVGIEYQIVVSGFRTIGVYSIRVYDAVIRLQGDIEAEKEEQEKWINKDMKEMMDSVKGTWCCYMAHAHYYKTASLC